MNKSILLLLLTVLTCQFFSQSAPDDLEMDEIEVYRSDIGEWGGIPGLNGEGISLMNQTSFFVLMGSAATSYLAAEFLTDTAHQNYYQSRIGVYGVSNHTTITLQSFGIEKRIANWFSSGIELIFQQWRTRDPQIHTGAGLGFNTYYRWHLLSKKRISPYLEYGAGVFNGFSPLPYNASRFTFHLTTSLGVEYNFSNDNLLRLSYGHLHQSNNGLFEPNPGLDGGGVQVTFLWFWKSSKGFVRPRN